MLVGRAIFNSQQAPTLRYTPSLMYKCHRCAIPPIGVLIPVCYRSSDLGRHQPASELPRETPLEDLTERKVMRRLSEADLAEKQDVKDDCGQQWCEEGSNEGLGELEADKGTSGGPGWRGGRKGVEEDGSGGEQGGGQSAASLTSQEAVEGEKESEACAEENVQQEDEEVVEELVGIE